MPIFTWNMLVTSVLVLIAFPVLTAAGAMLLADRHLGAHVFDADRRRRADPVAAPVLVLRPPRGVHPRAAVLRRGHRGAAGVLVAAGVRLQGHRLRHARASPRCRSACGPTTCSPPARCCCRSSAGSRMLIAVPTGVKFFNWIGTMWGGRITFPTPMLFAIGFLFTFLLGGLTGVMLASPPDRLPRCTDSYFVVAHMHYVLFGGSVFALFAGIYYWFPKFTGRLLHEGWGKLQFWLMFVGFNLTFFVQHKLGARGHAPAGRRLPARATGSPRSTGSRRSARSCSARRRCRSCGTCGGRCGAGEPAGDDPWGGPHPRVGHASPPPAAQLRPACPASARTARCGTCTTPTTRSSSDGRRRRRHRDLGRPPSATTPGAGDDSPGFDIQARIFVGVGVFVAVVADRLLASSPTRRPAPCCSRSPSGAGLHDRRLPRLDEAADRHDGRRGRSRPSDDEPWFPARERVAVRHRRRRSCSWPTACCSAAGCCCPAAAFLAYAIAGFVQQSRVRG